jgi:transcriptional regulator with XRE-family HTH domain
MNVTHVFALNVRAYRTKLGLSQEAFAEKCHLHRTYISALEREKRNISLKNVQAIAVALNVEPYLLFVEPGTTPHLDYNQQGSNSQYDSK